MSSDLGRAGHLARFFKQVTQGIRPLKSSKDAKLFIESICIQSNHQECIERLVASASALQALRTGLRFDVSANFVHLTLAPFLIYLSKEEVKRLSNGELLKNILSLLADPPTLWKAYLALYKKRSLESQALEAFTWLLLELASFPSVFRQDILRDAQDVVDDGFLLQSPSQSTRTYAYKIQNVLLTRSAPYTEGDPECAPGGRHDNDFADFRKVAIYPTADEFLSSEKSFYRRADAVIEVGQAHRVATHLDNQFRLLREDMLAELREDLQIGTGQKRGKRAAKILRKLTLVGLSCGEESRRRPCTMAVECLSGLEQLMKIPQGQRKTFLRENPKLLRHQSSGCLLRNSEIVAFTNIDRQEGPLSGEPPIIMLQVMGDEAFQKALIAFKQFRDLELCLVDTSFFAYEPVLRCLQEKSEFPLVEQLLSNSSDDYSDCSTLVPRNIVRQLQSGHDKNIQHLLGTAKAIKLDTSQLDSLLAGLMQPVSLIQGPPGTGKSFIGALLAKAFHRHTTETILVICYTNHALDQFLEDFLDIGIPKEDIVRLGSKSSPYTASLSISEQKISFKRTKSAWNVVDSLKIEANSVEDEVKKEFAVYQNSTIHQQAILDYLEFSEDDSYFFEALQTPESRDEMILVDRRGKGIKPGYVFDRWSRGHDAGVFTQQMSAEHPDIWGMEHESRQIYIGKWSRALMEEQISKLGSLKRRYDNISHQLEEAFGEKNSAILKSKRVIGCTTTAAAKYSKDLQAASPGIILVEEAGEILEAHVLTAMSSTTKQLVLIGDHKQLRPKVKDFELTVEKGEGYDLDRSLFERLVLSGHPHTTLLKQHRMSPPISALVRHLTYPDLQDAERTREHPQPRGIRDRVIFFNHNHGEVEDQRIGDHRDEGAKASKTNLFEAETVLAAVRYMAQQGYGTDKLVVLTPYLGQLFLLRNHLSKENDPVLNDLDSHDLVKAGLLSKAGAQLNKRPIRISTIDNYQGEESDIVIASLTRSNKTGDIGFMAAPQRLNVLLSRARIAIIMIGNANTFMSSRKGKSVWRPFFNYLKDHNHLYDGLPVKCERHPQKLALLKSKIDFLTNCPDGGCSEPCGTKLSCGQHDCPQRCHQLFDHSKMRCEKVMDVICSQKHKQRRPCFESGDSCRKCAEEDRKREEKRKRDMKLDQEREAKQKAYACQLEDLQDEIRHERRRMKDTSDEAERQRMIQQHQNDLNNLRQAPKQRPQATKSTLISPNLEPTQPNEKEPASEQHASTKNGESFVEASNKFVAEPPVSAAKYEWEHQKKFEGAENEALDSLMDMIALEDVKEKFLSIKSQVDTTVRQNIAMTGERFGATLLGNPGTGKTTVARIYAKFLTTVGALPGDFFAETTGSRLANDGVPGCKKQIEEILNNGGGVFFIDEAYQLISKSAFVGAQVLDFLLAEVENLTGKVVFVLAGYNKQMEAFFAHNPGIPSRFPHELQFKDYEDNELLHILAQKLTKKYGNQLSVEDGLTGLYARIVARRIGRGRGKEGFGNARSVENVCQQIAARQSKRLRRERRAGHQPNDFLFGNEDMIGPKPSAALQTCQAYANLQKLIGLGAVKKSIQALVQNVQFNYTRELKEEPLIEFSLNRVFLGSPGTGKTSVAKMYGETLAHIGLLSNGEVVVKNPSDFVGDAMGISEKNTKGILASTIGKVLVIDEAYGLLGGGGEGGGPQSDPYRTAVIDTIVAEVQSTPGEDRCVLLLGYKDQMEDMFQKVNPGLSRRFPLDSAFTFEDFNDEELGQIFDLKIEQQGFRTSEASRNVALDVLRRARNRPNFGNAGEIDILLNKAKAQFQQRLVKHGPPSNSAILVESDFDEDFNRSTRAETNVRSLFQGVVGCEEIVSQLEGYQQIARTTKSLSMNPKDHLPFNFLFRGPPGTGKTATARKMGKVYYDMGFLATAEVVECSATELVGQFVGQTGPKTQKLIEKALGKVLFIDEAYRLAEGPFAKEAMDEIVDCITKPKYAQKVIMILAGYDADINRLMSINPGLTSRFPEAIVFRPLNPTECLDLLRSLLQIHKQSLLKNKVDLDMTVLENTETQLHKTLLHRFEILARLGNWANARDVQTLTKAIFNTILKSAPNVSKILTISEDDVLTQIDGMINERTHRDVAPTLQKVTHPIQSAIPPLPVPNKGAPAPPILNSKADTATAHSESPPLSQAIQGTKSQEDARDAGVSDQVWAQLQKDKAAARAQEKEHERLLQEQSDKKKAADEERKAVEACRLATQQAADDEAKRRHEQERIRHELEQRAREAELEILRRKRQAEEKARRKEQIVQMRLRQMGVCPVGFRWIKQAGGYRCAGGSHWVTDGELGL